MLRGGGERGLGGGQHGFEPGGEGGGLRKVFGEDEVGGDEDQRQRRSGGRLGGRDVRGGCGGVGRAGAGRGGAEQAEGEEQAGQRWAGKHGRH